METSNLSGMCRCCALEGTFKDLKSTYHWMGEQEIYGDMLRECFNVLLSDEDDTDGGICEVCITQLRNAVNFKKRVLYTEEQFKKKQQNRMFKLSIVKVEAQGEDELDSDDNNMSADEAFPNTDYQVPIKFEEEPENPKPKKRSPKATASTSRVKKAKTDVGETSKRKTSASTLFKKDKNNVSTSKNKRIKATKSLSALKKTAVKEIDATHEADNDLGDSFTARDLTDLAPPKGEIKKHLQNINCILLHTNATPIKCYFAGVGYCCYFCPKRYLKAAELKTHTSDEHDDKAKSMFMKNIPKKCCSAREFLAKVDITSLTCLICSKSMESLEEVMHHLKSDHDKNIYTDIKNQIVPFKFDDGKLKCVICQREFNSFKLVLNHMNLHYGNFPCPKCDRAFVNFKTLRSHYGSHKQGDYICDHCPKVFNTLVKKKVHEKSVHLTGHKRSKCPHCGEMFVDYHKRLDHLVQKHGAEPMSFKCNACDSTFSKQRNLTLHIKKYHLMERKYECAQCDKKFFGKYNWTNHMLSHTGKKEFQCDFCLKAFPRKSSLTEHLRIHTNDRRFKCEHCGQSFVQKCSWKSHMQSKHGEIFTKNYRSYY